MLPAMDMGLYRDGKCPVVIEQRQHVIDFSAQLAEETSRQWVPRSSYTDQGLFVRPLSISSGEGLGAM